MNKLTKLLRRLKPWQILAVGAVVTLAALGLVLFGLCPLVAGLFAPLGPTAVTVAGFVVAVLGGIAVYLTIPKFFVLAYFARKIDDQILETIEKWRASKESLRG